METVPMVDTQKFGVCIRQKRLQRNWEQKDLAERIDRSVPTVSRIENGTLKLSLERMNALARAFDLTLHELLAHTQQDGGVHDPEALKRAQLEDSLNMMETLIGKARSLLQEDKIHSGISPAGIFSLRSFPAPALACLAVA